MCRILVGKRSSKNGVYENKKTHDCFFFHLLCLYLSYTPIKGFAMDIERCISLVCLWVFLELERSYNRLHILEF